jgi:hypothetical protein
MSFLVALIVVLQRSVLTLRPLSFTRRHVSAAALLAATTPAQLANAADTVRDLGPGEKLSREQIEGKLSQIPVITIVDGEGKPILEDGVGFFYLDPIEAQIALRVLRQMSKDARFKVVKLSEVYFQYVLNANVADQGVALRIRPPKDQVMLANRAAKKRFSQLNGQVPMFYSDKVSFLDEQGTRSFPFFLFKEELDKSYTELRSQGKIKGPALGEEGIPDALLRVVTLDGLVDQMLSGGLDLSQAVIVGSSNALVTKLFQDG